VDSGLLDVLHDAAEVEICTVEECVHVDLDRVVQEAVDEDRVLGRRLGGLLDVRDERVVVVDDDHAPPAEDVGRADEHRVADLSGHGQGLVRAERRAVLRSDQAGAGEHLAEGAAVLREMDRAG
jgi:hypothetical protein